MAAKEKLRLDKYLWAIRLFKTRSMATDACDRGKVKFDGSQAKPSKNVSINEEYEIKTEAKKWRVKITGLVQKRVAYNEAIQNYTDITPEVEINRLPYQAAGFHSGKRLSKTGRPTKKSRRDMDDFFEK